MTVVRQPRRFYAVAVGAGFAFANMAVAVPLHVVATGGRAAAAGDVLALSTVAIALGAFVAGRVGARAGSQLLLLALLVTGAGALGLSSATEVTGLAIGSFVLGLGIGMFWVSSQQIMSRRAGEPDGAHAFLLHYAAYTLGTVAGSTLTGAFASGARWLGLATATGIRASSMLAVAGVVAAVLVWRTCPSYAVAPGAPGRPTAPRGRLLAIQVPDLLLVAGLAVLLPLAPVVLVREFGLAPFGVGLVMGGVAVSKIAGTFVARIIARSSGPRRTILILLAAGTSFSLLLSSALTLSLFVTTLFATALAATGAWPLVVDAAQARIEPGARGGLAVRWNVREYALIAATTAASGWLLTAAGSAIPLFVLAAALFGGSAATAAILLRRPVWRPRPGDDSAPAGRAAAATV